MKRFAMLAVLSIALPACITDGAMEGGPASAQEQAPTNFRAAARDYLRESLFDPYSVRDAQISEPVQRSSWVMGEPAGWTVCFRGNAKNRAGGYTGIKETVLMIRGGQVVASTEGPAPYYCGDAQYRPFPEIMSAT